MPAAALRDVVKEKRLFTGLSGVEQTARPNIRFSKDEAKYPAPESGRCRFLAGFPFPVLYLC
jgi:hypothetical protein